MIAKGYREQRKSYKINVSFDVPIKTGARDIINNVDMSLFYMDDDEESYNGTYCNYNCEHLNLSGYCFFIFNLSIFYLIKIQKILCLNYKN